MSISRKKLLSHLDDELKPWLIKDYCPNGLQVEGVDEIQTIVTGVTASEALIDEAIARDADAILVHHGYFWKGEPAQVVGMKHKRLKKLLTHDINLIAYHLPLDIHPSLGNNAQLAKCLGIEVTDGLDRGNPQSVAMQGRFTTAVSGESLKHTITQVLGREPLHEGKGDIETVAWCTGGGQDFIEQAAVQGIDAFISGEVSERTILTAREMDIQFFAAGHHATERYGVKALGEHLANTLGLDVVFVDIDNPA